MGRKKESADPTQLLQYNKRIYIAAAITSIIVLGGLGGLTVYKWTQPTVSTIYYHYNIQYRCGDVSTYDHICEAVGNIVSLYEDHPTWNYTIECQFMLLEWMHDYFPSNFSQIQDQNQRGQLELITPQYSNQWHVPYPVKEFKESVNYTRTRMLEWGLTPSRLIVIQEGQWLPGFTQLGDTGMFDAAVMHIEQATYFKYYPNKPILEWDFGGVQKDVVVNPRMPVFEANTYHHQIYAADGELLNTGDIETHGGPADEFAFNPIKQRNHEVKLLELEKRGNKFMTMEQFYDFARKDDRNVGTLDKYIPECEWVAAQYDQYFTWMGEGGGGWTDDNTQLARYYYARNLIQATELMLNTAYKDGNITQQDYADWGPYRIGTKEGTLLTAKKHIWEAQVSDTTGISPRYIEFYYGLNNSYAAIEICREIIENITTAPGWEYSGKLQLNPYINKIVTDESAFVNDTLVSDAVTLTDIESIFGFDVSLTQKAEFEAIGYTEEYEKHYYNTTDWNVEYYRMFYEIRGQRNLTIGHEEFQNITESGFNEYNNLADGSSNDITIQFDDEWQKAIYSPSLAANETVQLDRDDYLYKPYGADEFVCLLAMCNGMIYNPAKGYGIVKNCSVGHLPATWRTDNIAFREEEVHYNSTREYYVVRGTLDQVHQFANQVNAYALFEEVI